MPSRHTAPAVRYPVQPSAWLARALLGVALLGGLVLLAWAVQGARTQQHALQWTIGALCWVLACVQVWRFWTHGVWGVLAWNGQAWTLELPSHREAQVGSVTVHLDLQAHLWLHWQSDQGAGHWLWLDQHSDRLHWNDLRRAVYSRAGSTTAAALPPVAPRDPSA